MFFSGASPACRPRPRPCPAGRRPCPSRPARRQGRPAGPAVPRRAGAGRVRAGLLLGRRAAFWETEGVYTTAVGYAGGFTPNPTYEEVCSGQTGHAEVVLVVFDPAKVSYEQLLKIFWEHHDPTQGMRQGNDVGTQYRSAIYTFSEAQRKQAEASRDAYQHELTRPATAPSPPRSARPRPSTTPRTTTSSTCTRSRTATAPTTAPA